MYANAEAATIQWGLATDQKTNGMQQAQCIIALMAITGNIDRPGGQITTGGAVALDADTEEDDEYMPYMALDDDELRGKMIGLKEYPAYCGMSQNSHADLTLRCMETDDPYPLRIGAFAGNNLLACTSAEPKRWDGGHQSFARIRHRLRLLHDPVDPGRLRHRLAACHGRRA